ncbi:unnamed protein product [Microthlaspi erraticum]|uniref:Uncharacterized protein n=1 Tax=Microthlaspi erraticum TaxID=1685480 RepID=A0A6D2IHR0_9BRAS|nr:unnamed protein product [Microthlaspi erraticum]
MHFNNNTTSPRNNNLYCSGRGYGLGQSSLLGNGNVGLRDSVPYMNRRPMYGFLSQNESNLLPRGFSNGILNLTEEERRSVAVTPQESQAPRFGQYGTSGNVLGMNSNLNTDTVGGNYAGITASGNGDLFGPGEVRVNGNDNGSFGGVRVHGTSNIIGNGNASLGGIDIHGTDNENANGCFGGIGVYGNDSLGGVRVHGTSNMNGHGNASLGGIDIHGTDNENGTGFFGGIKVYGIGSLDGIRVHGYGKGNVNGSLGETRLHGIGNGNGYLGETFGAKNWNFNNNMSNHESSSSSFPSAMSSFLNDGDQSHMNFTAQTDNVALVQENPSMLNDHYGTNGIFSDTIDSQFQHQDKVSGENLGLPTYHDLAKMKGKLVVNPLEDIDNWSFKNHQDKVSGENLGLPTYHDLAKIKGKLVVNPLEDTDDWSFKDHQDKVSGENLALLTYHNLAKMKGKQVVNPLEDTDNWSFENEDPCAEYLTDW